MNENNHKKFVNLLYSIFPIKICEMNGFLSKPDPYNDIKSIAFAVGYYCKILPLFPYVYFNMYNIDFSGWMRDIMRGLKREYMYPNCSYFIRKSCCYRDSLQPLAATPNETVIKLCTLQFI